MNNITDKPDGSFKERECGEKVATHPDVPCVSEKCNVFGKVDIVDANVGHLDSVMAVYNALSISGDIDHKIDKRDDNSFSNRGGILKVPDQQMIRDALEAKRHFFRIASSGGETQGFLWGCYDFSPSEPFYHSFMREGETTDDYLVFDRFNNQGLVAYGMDLMIDPKAQRSSLGIQLYHEYAMELKKRGVKKVVFMAEKLKSIQMGGSVIEVDMHNDATLHMHSLFGATLIKTIYDEVKIENDLIARRSCMYFIVDVDNLLEVLSMRLGIDTNFRVSQISNEVLEAIKRNLIVRTAGMSEGDFTIRGIWDFKMRVQPRDGERLFTESGYLVATSGLGASFSSRNSDQNIDSLIGKDGRDVVTDNVALQVAILDACYGALSQHPSEEFVLFGDTVSKASERASIVSNEVKRVVEKYSIVNARVLMIGVVQTIVDELVKGGMSPLLSDMDPNLIEGQNQDMLTINHGEQNKSLIPDSDVILVTGMTLATSTISEIISAAKKRGKPIVVFAQSGSNLAEEYIRLGVETVVAEHYPWYCMPGRSLIDVFRSVESKCTDTENSRTKIADVVRTLGTPIYIYDAQRVRENAIRLKNAFDWCSVYYSVKANPNHEVCAILSKLGYEAEVVTEGEMKVAIRSGFNAQEMLFAGPGKMRNQIKNAISSGVSFFTAESMNQLRLLNKVASEENVKIRVLLRINLPELINEKSESMMGGNSQFGLDINSVLAEKASLGELRNVEIAGTQFYAASQILDPKKLAMSVSRQLYTTQQLMKEIPMNVEVLDVGGGFGIPYKGGESDLDLDQCSALMKEAISKANGIKPKIIIESGRYLVGNAGTFFTKVIDVKESFGKYHVICDGGVVGFTRPALVRSPHRVELFETTSLSSGTKPCTVSGFSCSSLDTFDTVEMQPPEIGDIIAIKDAGAYGLSMSIQGFHCVQPPKEFIINK